jgi:hypothetical protein
LFVTYKLPPYRQIIEGLYEVLDLSYKEMNKCQ